MALSKELIEEIKAEYARLSYGEKGQYMEEKAKQFNVSVRTLSRHVKPEVSAKERKQRDGISKHPDEWAVIVAGIKKRPPEEAGEISTEQAVRIAVKNGLIPQEAQDIDRRTFDRKMAKMGLNRIHKPIVRYQAEYANKAHHFDASSSKFLYVAKYTADKEPILKLFRPAKHYKNKPTPVRTRPWAYGVVDDYSGKLCCKYVIALGENMTDSIAFLANYGWRKLGLPETLLADQGMLKKGLATQDFLARLDVDFPESNPYAKEAHGKIERSWRTLWQRFEKTLFALDNWKSFEITLTELNTMLERYLEEYNSRPHRYEKNISREDAWHRSLLNRGGKIILPENALDALCKRSKRKVGTDGALQYEGNTYMVKGCYDEWVYVMEGVFADQIIAQCIKTGEKHEVTAFEVLNYGEYRAVPETPHQKLIKDSKNISITKTLYTEDKEHDKIQRIPLKEAERVISNPMDTSAYSSIDKAMADFYNLISGTVSLSAESREKLSEAIIQNGLNRKYVKEIAEKLIKSINKSNAG